MILFTYLFEHISKEIDFCEILPEICPKIIIRSHIFKPSLGFISTNWNIFFFHPIQISIFKKKCFIALPVWRRREKKWNESTNFLDFLYSLCPLTQSFAYLSVFHTSQKLWPHRVLQKKSGRASFNNRQETSIYSKIEINAIAYSYIIQMCIMLS